MNKNEKPFSLKGKGTAVGIVICFVAVIVMVGAFTFNNYQKKLDEQFAKQHADIGWRVEQGWAIDKDGNISSWAIGHKDSKVKSFLQNMSEKAEEILQKQLEKAKDTKEEKEVFSMKKHKEVIKKNKVDLKV